MFLKFTEEEELINKARTLATMLEFANSKGDPTISKHAELLRDCANTIDDLVGGVRHYQERVDILEKQLFEAEKDKNGDIPSTTKEG